MAEHGPSEARAYGRRLRAIIEENAARIAQEEGEKRRCKVCEGVLPANERHAHERPAFTESSSPDREGET